MTKKVGYLFKNASGTLSVDERVVFVLLGQSSWGMSIIWQQDLRPAAFGQDSDAVAAAGTKKNTPSTKGTYMKMNAMQMIGAGLFALALLHQKEVGY
ncbi:MAG: hypothetical protein HHJ09_02495 [Glaciimonas sp.]|nr:hypothetical protein [Glaciimonas sp.]